MTLTDLLAKLAAGEHIKGCDCYRCNHGPICATHPSGCSQPNACLTLARQAKELNDGGIKMAVRALDTLGGPSQIKFWLTEDEANAAVVATGHWTSDPPTTPGWYYIRSTAGGYKWATCIRQVWETSGVGLVVRPNDETCLVADCEEWEWWSIPLWLPPAPKEESRG